MVASHFAPLRASARFVCATLSAMVAVGLLTHGLQRDGMPFQHVITAERACVGYPFASDRDACVNASLARSEPRITASR